MRRLTIWARLAPLALLVALRLGAQGPAIVRIAGAVRRADTREAVRHAHLVVDGVAAAQTNEDGVYALRLAVGARRLQLRAVGVVPLDTTIVARADTTLDLAVAPITVTLASVHVTAEARPRDVDPRSPAMSLVTVDPRALRTMPAVLGEVDPIRSLTLLPGVSSSSDFTTAFNVRGGAADQNLILLDDATIYNPAHALGFLSVFNVDAIDDVTLYKGAIPSRYGGRLSSVVDLRQREGDATAFAGRASVGLLASRIALEGPLPGGASWLVAARRSYADLLAHVSSDPDVRDEVAWFSDVNMKLARPLGTGGSRLVASAYLGHDRYANGADFAAGWGNASATLRWDEVAHERLYSKLTLAASDYCYRVDFPLGDDSVSWRARIRSLALKADETLHLADGHRLEFGVESTLHGIRPGAITPRGDAPVTGRRVSPRTALAGALYADEERELGSRWSVRYGARLSAFSRVGAATIYRYADDRPVVHDAALGRDEPGTIVDSVRYGSGARVRTFAALEPRGSLRLALTPTTSLKAGYARTAQYLHRVSKANAPTPLDVWEPAGPYLHPQRADQLTLGWQRTRGDGGWELSAETFYKRVRDVVDFVDGADVMLEERPETITRQGRGRAYGLELFARRTAGATTGWVSYTLARAEQRFAATASDPGPGGGRWYAAPYDKTHDLSVVATRRLHRRWTVGSTFTLASGLPATYPVSRYQVDGLLVAEYGARNAARLPLYHRLDLSATRQTGRGELQVGLFNAYGHFNAQSIAFRQSVRDPLVAEAVEVSVFGIVPSLSYSVKF
jgi:hypothetical protein